MSPSTDTLPNMTARKRLLLLGGGFEQLNALNIARELGADVIVFDGHEDAACSYAADEFYQVNIKDHTALIEKVRALNIDAVFVHAAELAIEAALVAETFDLPGISKASAVLGTDKVKRSECLAAAGVSVPQFVPLSGTSPWVEWQHAAKGSTLPIIVKPTSMAGAQGVEFIDSLASLKEYFEAKQCFGEQDFLMEEFVSGLQLSTESVVLDGRVAVTNIAFRHYDTTEDLWPFQIEDGHSMPWNICDELQHKLDRIIDKCRIALGIDTGVLKGDIVVTDDNEVIVLEMAVRTSGGRFCDLVAPVSTGVNILYPLLQHALGQKPDKRYLQAHQNFGVSQRFVFLPAGTAFSNQKAIQHILLQKDVIGHWFREDLHLLEVAPKIKSHRDRLGYVVCAAETRELADRRANEVIVEIKAALTAEGQS